MKCKLDDKDICHNPLYCSVYEHCPYEHQLNKLNIETSSKVPGNEIWLVNHKNEVAGKIVDIGYKCKLTKCMYPINCTRNQICLAIESERTMESKKYDSVEYPDGKGYKRNGSPFFYKLLERMADIHDKKSHDYASNDNPMGNYHFAGQLSKLFNNPLDAGFIGRIGEKLYRLANIENSGKSTQNESIEDTEIDIAVITLLWMADRQSRRTNPSGNKP